ncbi:MAG: glycerophosphodiester phosphodiesterase family protein [Planctomycetota bacterium]|jgi:glycerophosphoryl diester phosphodiesterase
MPIVIAHRGASGYRPEHTLESYRLAIEQGADFIEPDLVPTRDGELIARHENLLDDTTNIAELVREGALPDRRATKRIDGVESTGYFSEDYTLAEIRKLRARERIPDIRPQNCAFDGRFGIPTFREVIALARDAGRDTGRPVGVYPETKHPTFFALDGRHHDGAPIGLDISRTLVETLVAEQFTDPARVYIQSFEFANLIALRDCGFPLIQLYGDTSPSEDRFARPYDMGYHAARGDDLRAIYGELADLVSIRATTGYGDLVSSEVVRHIRKRYATGVGPWKTTLFAGAAPALLDAGLEVHPYTLRAEAQFLEPGSRTMQDEIQRLLDLGATGFFTDNPDLAVRFVRR